VKSHIRKTGFIVPDVRGEHTKFELIAEDLLLTNYVTSVNVPRKHKLNLNN
jgi:hypothetical protein